MGFERRLLHSTSYERNCFITELDIYQLTHSLYNNVLVYNVNIRTLKTLQHVSIYIQIILRELVVSSLKSLSLKLPKI